MTQNKRELVEAALHNKPVDRVPVGFWFHFLEDQRNTDAVSDPALEEQNLAGHRNFIESWHPDFVKIMTDGFFPISESGCDQADSIDSGCGGCPASWQGFCLVYPSGCLCEEAEQRLRKRNQTVL